MCGDYITEFPNGASLLDNAKTIPDVAISGTMKSIAICKRATWFLAFFHAFQSKNELVRAESEPFGFGTPIAIKMSL
jgi:hypothetical protein